VLNLIRVVHCSPDLRLAKVCLSTISILSQEFRFYTISQHDLEFYNFLSWKMTISSSRVLVYVKLNIPEEYGNIIETDAFWLYVVRCSFYLCGQSRLLTKNPYIEEEQTTQWPKEKVQKKLMYSGRVNSFCSTSDTHDHRLHCIIDHG
jgi:hypothetical protein